MHSKSKDLSQTDEDEHHHRKGGRRKGDLDSPALDPSAVAVGGTVQEIAQKDSKVSQQIYCSKLPNYLK